MPQTSHKQIANNFVDLEVFFDGNGAVLPTGIYGDVRLDFPCTIVSHTLLSVQTGSIVIDIWKDTFTNFPPTVGDTITAAAKPTLSAANKSEDTTLTGWSKTTAAGSILRFNIDSVSSIFQATLVLKLKRT
jgi:hypothetical protein